MKKLSLIVNVLESYEIVRRQLLHLERILTDDCELIVVDDGSFPSLQATCDLVRKSFDFVLHCTNDRRPWTQPRARNIGAEIACAPKLLFFDIDHIITRDILSECLTFTGDKLHWVRRPGILDEAGCIITDSNTLAQFGLTDDSPSIHCNSFMIRREMFFRLGGYNERFCGKYGGDDIDFNARYDHRCQKGLAKQPAVQGQGYYFPDPAFVKELFHSLRRESSQNGCQVEKTR
jgi:predicted glycosyltransferase involved in capsule biosynthesis